MEIKHLEHSQIDKPKWDHLIDHSKQQLIYAHSSYLDIVAPSWCALVIEENDEYVAVFPIAVQRFLWYKYSSHPFFAQQLGWFFKNKFNNTPNIQETTAYIRKAGYSMVSTNLNWSTPYPSLNERITYTLDLSPSYDDLFKNYSRKRRPNVNKSKKIGVELSFSSKNEDFIERYSDEMKEKLNLSDRHFSILDKLLDLMEEKKLLTHIYAKHEGEIHSEGIFIRSYNRIIFLASYSTFAGRDTHAASAMLDAIIEKYAESNLTLDLEGGNIPEIGSFFKSFGTSQETFSHLHFNNFPFWLKPFKK